MNARRKTFGFLGGAELHQTYALTNMNKMLETTSKIGAFGVYYFKDNRENRVKL